MSQEGSCPHYGCNDEVVIVGCPDCGATNGCWCPRCFHCGNKESKCSCTRCTRCRNKIFECTCYLYPDPGTGGGTGGGSGGGGSVTPPPPPNPEAGTPTLDKICSKNTTLTSTQKKEIEEGINTLKNTYPKASALFSKLESSKIQITIAIDPNMPKGTVKYDHSTHTLTFLGSQYSASFGALEDWAHVAQCEVYYKSDIPSNRTLEFEAKMFCDLNCAINADEELCNALRGGFNNNVENLEIYDNLQNQVVTTGKFTSDLLESYYALGRAWNDPVYQSGTFQTKYPNLLLDLVN